MEKRGTSFDPKSESWASPQPGKVFNSSHLSCCHTKSPDTRLLTQHPQVETV